MKRLYMIFFLLSAAASIFAEDSLGESESDASATFLTRAKKRISRIKMKDLIELAPFAIVAKCYTDAPNLTMAALGVTLVVIALRNAYIEKKAKKAMRFIIKAIYRINKKYGQNKPFKKT